MRDIWDFWAGTSLRDPLDKLVPNDVARLIHARGGDLLPAEVTDPGSGAVRPRTWHESGYQIVEHGFYLRMVQIEEIRQDAFREAVAFRRGTGIVSADGRGDWTPTPMIAGRRTAANCSARAKQE